MAVAVVILAAGRGSRFAGDAPKPLASFEGRRLVDWALDAPRGAGLHPVVLVVGHDASRVAADAPPGTIVVRARSWQRGISRSLAAALAALDGWVQVSAACIGLADQPRVGPEAYRRLVAAHEAGADFAVATYGGRRANPVLLGRTLWTEARGLRGDEGARQLMGRHPVVEVDCTGTGDPRDVDTLADLAALGGNPDAPRKPDAPKDPR